MTRQYMSAIFYHTDEQKLAAQKSREEHQKHLDLPIQTVITPALHFYEAEDYHQKYMLRQHSEVLEKLKLSDKEIIQSPVASLLNGYLGGYGSEEQFQQDCDEGHLQLPESTEAYVQKVIKEKA